jgi:DNA primase
MISESDMLSLVHAFAACRAHADALRDALADLTLRQLTSHDLEHPAKTDRRLLDQFAYRYTRLQDDMGARLMPATLRALGEDIAPLSMLDRLNRLEQIEWLPSADEWSDLRRVRNEFTHDYPEALTEQYSRLCHALASAQRVLEILDHLSDRIRFRFPQMPGANSTELS